MSVREVMHCSTCKWWSGQPHFLEYKGEIIVDNNPRPLRPHMPCGCPKIVDVSRANWDQCDKLPLDIAWYSDREDYGAIFRTGPDFGCVHWEAKE